MISHMLALGLDPSLRAFGWCIYDPHAATSRNRRRDSGHEGTLSTVVPVARYIHFRSMVRSLMTRNPDIKVVGIESPAYGGGPFSENHFGLMMFSLETIFDLRVDCVLFDPTTLKMLVGDARANKTEVQRYVQLDTMDPDVINNNEADAYCVARFASRFMMIRSGELKPEDLTETERRVFLSKVKKKKSVDGIPSFKRTAHAFRENSRFFEFSRVPPGNVALPVKSAIRPDLLAWLEWEDVNSSKKTSSLIPKE